MIEIVGDFDAGRDVLEDAQRQAVIEVVAAHSRRLSDSAPSDDLVPQRARITKDLPWHRRRQERSARTRYNPRWTRLAGSAAPAVRRAKGEKAEAAALAPKTGQALPASARAFLLRDSVAAHVGEPAPKLSVVGRAGERIRCSRDRRSRRRALVRASMHETRRSRYRPRAQPTPRWDLPASARRQPHQGASVAGR